MGQEISETMRRLADELGERAELQIEIEDDGGERLALVPRNPAAAPVYVEHDLDGEYEQRLYLTDQDFGEPFFDHQMDWLEARVRAAIDGRVTVLEGSGRVRIDIEETDGVVKGGTAIYFWRGFSQRQGGRRRRR